MGGSSLILLFVHYLVDSFSVASKSTIDAIQVGNALPELVEWYKEHGKNKDKIFQATERCASGILQSLQHFSLGPHLSPRDRMGLNGIDSPILSSESRNGRPAMHGCAQREVVEFNTLFEKWINAEVPNNAETFQRLTRVIVSVVNFCVQLPRTLDPPFNCTTKFSTMF
jgi:hypothetical protein